MLEQRTILAMPSLNTVHSAWRFVRFVDYTGDTILHTTPENCAIIDLGDGNNPDHIMCHQCRMIKPVKDFKRVATKAQALAWGYSGRVALEYVGKSCKSCYTPPKHLSQLTPLQIKQRISSGNHIGSEGLAKVVLENRIKKGKDAIRAGIKKRLRKDSQVSWNPLLIAVKETSRRFTRQISDIKAKGDNDGKGITPSNNTSRSSPFSQRLAYTTLILDIARGVTDEIKAEINKGVAKPEAIKRWQDMIDEDERSLIQQYFDAIPPEQRKNMRPTAILSYFKY